MSRVQEIIELRTAVEAMTNEFIPHHSGEFHAQCCCKQSWFPHRNTETVNQVPSQSRRAVVVEGFATRELILPVLCALEQWLSVQGQRTRCTFRVQHCLCMLQAFVCGVMESDVQTLLFRSRTRWISNGSFFAAKNKYTIFRKKQKQGWAKNSLIRVFLRFDLC